MCLVCCAAFFIAPMRGAPRSFGILWRRETKVTPAVGAEWSRDFFFWFHYCIARCACKTCTCSLVCLCVCVCVGVSAFVGCSCVCVVRLFTCERVPGAVKVNASGPFTAYSSAVVSMTRGPFLCFVFLLFWCFLYCEVCSWFVLASQQRTVYLEYSGGRNSLLS